MHHPCRLQGNHRHQGKRNNCSHVSVIETNQFLHHQPRNCSCGASNMFCVFLCDHTKLAAAAGPGKEGVASQHSFPPQCFPCRIVSRFGLVWFGLAHQPPWLFFPMCATGGCRFFSGFLTKQVQKTKVDPFQYQQSHDSQYSSRIFISIWKLEPFLYCG